MVIYYNGMFDNRLGKTNDNRLGICSNLQIWGFLTEEFTPISMYIDEKKNLVLPKLRIFTGPNSREFCIAECETFKSSRKIDKKSSKIFLPNVTWGHIYATAGWEKHCIKFNQFFAVPTRWCFCVSTFFARKILIVAAFSTVLKKKKKFPILGM